jgi:hypothetical protein
VLKTFYPKGSCLSSQLGPLYYESRLIVGMCSISPKPKV